MSGVSSVPALLPALSTAFLVGLAGSVHCAGMCGGIVGALSMPRGGGPGAVPGGALPAAFPLPVRTLGAAPLARVGAYNAGRIASYMAAGALAGGAAALAPLPGLRPLLYWAANLMLVALGLYLMDAWRGLAWLELGGQALWRRIGPLLRRLRPMDGGAARMFAAGALWGWLPCGMVYSMLATAMMSGSALAGALSMLAFGLGTLPMLGALGVAGQGLRRHLQRRRLRLACGLAVLAFGLLGLARAAGVVPHEGSQWLDMLCLGGGRPA